MLRHCLRDPIPEIEIAAERLKLAALAHLHGERDAAEELLLLTNDEIVRGWLESVWGKKTHYNQRRSQLDGWPTLPEAEWAVAVPSSNLKRLIHQRDGFYCRYCHIPVISKSVRVRPRSLIWNCSAFSASA